MAQERRDSASKSAFIKKLDCEIMYITTNLKQHFNEEFTKEFIQLEKIKASTVQSIKTLSLSERDMSQIYKGLLKQIKKFKRKVQNTYKFNLSDYESLKIVHRFRGLQLLPLIDDIKFSPKEEFEQFTLEQLCDINMPALSYKNSDLAWMTLRILELTGYYEQFGVPLEMLEKFIYEVSLRMNVNPYHNFTHVFSLFQMITYCIEFGDVKEFLTPIECFACQIGALVHDLNHKGLNNGYKAMKISNNSIIYSQQGILEKMHQSQFYDMCLKDPNINIFQKFNDPNSLATFKKCINSIINGTDMAKHADLVAKMGKRVENSVNEEKDNSEWIFSSSDAHHRRFVAKILIHACDIGNACQEKDVYLTWARMIAQEWQDQTVKEAKNNLQVTGFMIYKDKTAFLNGQLFWAKNMVLPIWTACSRMFPKLENFPETLKANLIKIDDEKKKLEANVETK